jgi:hypothetical protein
MKFRDLSIGDRFDFVGPDPMLNSFYDRCTKIAPRKYRDDKRNVHTVGSVNAKVYNVEITRDTSDKGIAS